jgi:hypothetical protein
MNLTLIALLTATQNHPPLIIFFFLTSLTFVSALLVGYATSDNKERDWLHPVIFANYVAYCLCHHRYRIPASRADSYR